MKTWRFIFPVIMILILSCSESDNQETKAEVDVPEITVVEMEGDESKHLASLDISGMSCEKMCVNAVSKKLRETEGVKEVKVEFKKDRDLNFAHVDYDESVVSAEELIQAVHGIANGAYQVKNAKVEKHILIDAREEEEHSDTLDLEAYVPTNTKDFASSSSTIIFPNIFDVFFGLFK